MMSYRFRRRAFLAASGGLGLKVLLRNLEAAAQTTQSPPRFLLTHWPVGIVAGSNDSLWAPTSGSATGSQAMQPFVDAGLDSMMSVFRGLSIGQLSSGGCAGSHEGGTPKMTTGVSLVTGCRASDSEGDDGVAGGPSIDQILLTNVPALTAPMGGQGYANAICDSRVDKAEIVKQLAMKKSVLDFALEEINQMGTMAPSIAKNRLDTHASAIRSVESSITASLQHI